MIKIEHTMVTGWEPAIRGARNPMNSWDKSDSLFLDYYDEDTDTVLAYNLAHDNAQIDAWTSSIAWTEEGVKIGPNDLKLLTNLANAGSDEAKFRRMIVVYVDITAPMYWWKEADTYKVGTVRNSCSTMHKIHAKEFTPEDFSTEHLFKIEDSDIPGIEKIYGVPVYQFDEVKGVYAAPFEFYNHLIAFLNHLRKVYLVTKDKRNWWQMIQLLPSSYNQRATLMLNYEVLANMYHARRNHKLDEWRSFCDWIETLPYAKELIIGEERDTDEQLRARFKSYEDQIRYLEEEFAKELHKAYDMSAKDISERLSIPESAVKFFIDGGE